MTTIIDEIKAKGYCTGCGLCVSISEPNALEMQINNSGYLRPVVLKPLSKNDQAAIKEFCPGIHLEHSANSIQYHPLWGPLINTRTGFSIDSTVRKQGSSGGVISALAIYLLETKKVDFIAQTAVSPAEPLKNILQISRTKDDVIRAAGSRYAPSAPLERIIELLKSGETFAFIGKPCDVAGLRHFLSANKKYAHQIKYLISFMCAGMPSLHATNEVLNVMGADKSKLVSFRYRGDGWPGMAKAIQNDGQSFEMDYNSSWGNILGKTLQFRCKLCPDGTGEFADIVCADAWYGKDGYPDFTERDGRSLILSRTTAGEALIKEALHEKAIDASSLNVDEIEKMQPYQVTRKKVVLGRIIAAGLVNHRFVKYKNLGLLKTSTMINPIVWVKHAWGTFKRTSGEKQ
ncbi:Coenzyme F420 hydrogenase/dehydrogenase, beta subunit C-terminal domain [Methylophilus sp. TWE2]|uniref:Coenzyme F420 hydrogenase/dehydrogenase, beta subunit C-terminal domain n=1 Tax=Methylophilus sp. TWE2 TaxID=1662285 RepID=UPI00067096AC|nr:Coenzyme F420 hydrogenase/dehydrogenase, beta subunit C-terminal domain [Methylophilus sp. TWE2]AKR43392.1 hypothetical protein ACJ67_08100 [Methylophilus sp. TWE2]